jgi:hypothetical protein
VTSAAALADIEDVSAFLAFGVRAKLVPSRSDAYLRLVRRYIADSEFATEVHAAAKGWGLSILDVSVRSGLVLVPQAGSLFEIKMDDYVRMSSRENRDREKVLHGIVHLAAAALCFPRPDDLADDAYIGRVSVASVDIIVRETCRLIQDRIDGTAEGGDPTSGASELEEAWRVYMRRPETASTRNSKQNPVTTLGIASRALRWLADRGLLVQVSEEDGGTYRTTGRYQVHVRELAAHAAFQDLVSLGVQLPITGDGGLDSPAVFLD